MENELPSEALASDQALSRKQKVLLGSIGFLVGLSPVLFPILFGVDYYRAGRNYGEWLVIQVQELEKVRILTTLIFFLLIPLILLLRNRINITMTNFIVIPLLIGQLLLYVALDLLFFHGAMIFYSFVIGSVFYYDMILNTEIKTVERRSKVQSILPNSIGRRQFLGIILSLLIMFSYLPALFFVSPSLPAKVDTTGKYSVVRVSYEHIVDTEFLNFITPEYSGNVWKTYLYIPQGISGSVPVVVFLHGHSGSDPKYYTDLLQSMSSQGALVVFAQYSSYFDQGKFDKYIESKNMSFADQEIPENYYRYHMEQDAIDEFFSLSNVTGSKVNTLLSGITIDPSRLMIVGHSLGGGMTIYMANHLLSMGYGSNKFLLDIEAGWIASLESDLSILPDHTLAQVVIYEDDSVVPSCFGASHYERIRSRDNSTPLPSDQVSFVFVQTDFHGYPRDLANHYSPTDLIKFNIYYHLRERLASMAEYLSHDIPIDFMSNTDMGVWSDGRSFNPLIRSDDPLGIRGGDGIAHSAQIFESSYC